MLNWFLSLDITIRIQIIAIIAATVTSILAITISVSTLILTNKISRESNRANITFIIDKIRSESYYSLIIKNFGKTSGKLLEITLNPPLSYEKSRLNLNKKILTECTNIYLAPNQCLKSIFDFQSYPDREFEVTVKYKTLGKIYTDCYTINLDYRDSIITSSKTLKDTNSILNYISENIRELSDKLG